MEEIRIFSGRSHPRLAKDICQQLGIPPSPLKNENYDNGCIERILKAGVRGKLVFLVQTSVPDSGKLHRDIWELFEILETVSKLRAKDVVVVMPYTSYSRSDKEYDPRMIAAGELLVRDLEHHGMKRFIGISFHSNRFEDFFSSRTRIHHLAYDFIPFIIRRLAEKNLKNTIVLPGDQSVFIKASHIAYQLDTPIVYVEKERISDTKVEIKIRKEDEEKVAGKDIIIFDDETSTGTTVKTLAEEAKRIGANENLTLALIHGPFTKKAVKIFQDIKGLRGIIVTDTTPIPKKIRKSLPLTVIPTAGLLAETIKKISEEYLK